MSKSSASLETEIPADPTSLEVLAELPWLRRFPQRSPTLPPATHTNAYILGEHELVIVDPGTPSVDENNRLLTYLRTLSQDAERAGKQLRVIGIFLTHHHRDHVSGAAYLQRALQVPVWAHHQTALRVEVLHREEDLRVHRIIEDGELDRFVKARYATFETGVGKTVTSRKSTFESLEKHALKLGSVLPASGRQEMLENLINDYL